MGRAAHEGSCRLQAPCFAPCASIGPTAALRDSRQRQPPLHAERLHPAASLAPMARAADLLRRAAVPQDIAWAKVLGSSLCAVPPPAAARACRRSLEHCRLRALLRPASERAASPAGADGMQLSRAAAPTAPARRLAVASRITALPRHRAPPPHSRSPLTSSSLPQHDLYDALFYLRMLVAALMGATYGAIGAQGLIIFLS